MYMLAFVLDGRKRIYKADDQGKEITLYHVGPGGIYPLMILSVLTEQVYLANAVALDPMNLYVVPAHSMRRAASRHESFRKALLTQIYHELWPSWCSFPRSLFEEPVNVS